MVIHLSQRFISRLCLFIFFFLFHFFICFKYDFYVDADSLNMRKVKKYLRRWFKTNVWPDISSKGKKCRYLLVKIN